jgi:hypothetical protein
VPEDVSSGLLMTIGQITGIGFIFGLDALIPRQPCVPTVEQPYIYPGSSILLVVSVSVSFLFILMFKGSTKRLNVDLCANSSTPFNLIDGDVKSDNA